MGKIAKERYKFYVEEVVPAADKYDRGLCLLGRERDIVRKGEEGKSVVSGPYLVRYMNPKEELTGGEATGLYLSVTKEIGLRKPMLGESLDPAVFRHEFSHSRYVGGDFSIRDLVGGTFSELCADYYSLRMSPGDSEHKRYIRLAKEKFYQGFAHEGLGSPSRAKEVLDKIDSLARRGVGYTGKKVVF